MTARDYAKKYSRSLWSIQWMCRKGELDCQLVGNMWLVKDQSPPVLKPGPKTKK